MIFIHDCDTALYQAFMDNVIKPLKANVDWRWDLTVNLDGRADCNNLIEWCHYIWTGKLAALSMEDDMEGDWVVVQAATNIARRSQRLPWEAVVSQLEGLRVVAGKVDAYWRQ